MNIFYEEDGTLKAATVLADNDTSLQVETPHGKRAKVKGSNVLLKFAAPAAAGFIEEAEKLAADIDADFLWECCGEAEFGFQDLARDYFGHEPSPLEAAAAALKCHGNPMYFYKKAKGRYKAAPEENLKAALAGQEKKRLQEQKKAEYVEQLSGFALPPELAPQVYTLLLRPDKNTIEYKALEQASQATGLPPHRLLARCGALPAPHEFHLTRFLLEQFPKGRHFPEDLAHEEPGELPLSDAVAFSIDDAATTEIDDAFSVTRLPNGNLRIGIHIAAPGLGIRPRSPLEAVARARLSTVYMPGDKITMLPDAFVQRFTLQEGRACPALSLYLEVTPDSFDLVSSHSRAERVPIGANLRHDTLEPVFNEETLKNGVPAFPFRDELLLLWDFADRLEERRGRPDAGKVFPNEYSFAVEGDRVTITPRRRGTPIDKLVSELMICVNSTWAKLLADNGVVAVYRAQDTGKVRMTTAPAPHRGLGVGLYMWSSSPLRRYIDLLNQRQLIAFLRGEEPPHTPRSAELFAAMRDFELAYAAYNDFQRTMERYWSLRWLQQEGVQEAEGKVLKENLVRLSNLPLVTRLHGLPETSPGTLVRLGIEEVDLLDLDFAGKFKTVTREAAEPEADGTEEE